MHLPSQADFARAEALPLAKRRPKGAFKGSVAYDPPGSAAAAAMPWPSHTSSSRCGAGVFLQTEAKTDRNGLALGGTAPFSLPCTPVSSRS